MAEAPSAVILRTIAKAVRFATNPLRKLPDAVVIGAQKAGTSSLYEYVVQYPDVQRAWAKELQFFDRAYYRGAAWYRAQFPLRSKGGTTVEASPEYLLHPHVPVRMRSMLPAAKLIVLLREPVERAYSHYRQNIRLGRDDVKTFEEAIALEEERTAAHWQRLLADPEYYPPREFYYHTYLRRGHYAEQLERWFAAFPRGRFLIIHSGEFFADPRSTTARVLSFMGLTVQTTALDAIDFRPVNVGGAQTVPSAAPETQARLAAEFAPHNERLFALLGVEAWW